MSYVEPEDEMDNDSEPSGPKQLRDRLAQEQAKTAELQASLDAAADAQKELAFLKAGLPEDSKTANYFRSTYNGDLTAEAIKAAAVEAGIIEDANPELTQAVQGQAQMANAIQGAQPPQFGQVTVGPSHAPIAVPAEDAELYQKLEAAARRGYIGMQEMAQILRQAGHDVGIGDTEPLHVAPQTIPLNQQSGRIL